MSVAPQIYATQFDFRDDEIVSFSIDAPEIADVLRDATGLELLTHAVNTLLHTDSTNIHIVCGAIAKQVSKALALHELA